MQQLTGNFIRYFINRPRATGALVVAAGGLICTLTLAQSTPPVPSAPTSPTLSAGNTTQVPAKAGVGSKVTKKPENKLAWVNLSEQQHQALEPLAGEWPKLSELQKEKWLVIGKKFAKMTPNEQQRLHERMRDWAKLTPAERSAARTNYARAKKLDPEQKTEQWNKYQQLSAEQRKKLEQSKQPKRVAKLPSSANKTARAVQLPPETLEHPFAPATSPVLMPAAPLPSAQPVSQATPVSVAAPTPAATTSSTTENQAGFSMNTP